MVQKEQRLYLKIANKSDWVIMEDILCLLVRTKKSYAENNSNPLNPNLAEQYFRSDLKSNLFDTLSVFLKEFYEKVHFEKCQQTTKKACKKYPACNEVNNKISSCDNLLKSLGKLMNRAQ